jgi:hypothetical protein
MNRLQSLPTATPVAAVNFHLRQVFRKPGAPSAERRRPA